MQVSLQSSQESMWTAVKNGVTMENPEQSTPAVLLRKSTVNHGSLVPPCPN